MKSYTISITILTLLLFSACKSNQEIEPASEGETATPTYLTVTQQQFDASGMKIGTLSQRPFAKTIDVNGKVYLPNRAKAIISSNIGGTLGKLNLSQGQYVTKGTTLFTITNPQLIDLQEEYLVLQSRLSYLKNEVVRKESLKKENLTSNNDVLLAQTDYQSSLARFSSIGQKLKVYGIAADQLNAANLRTYMAVRAPISGYITGLNAIQGQFIAPETPLATVLNKSAMEVVLHVLEKDAIYLKKGQKVSLSPQNRMNQSFEGQVSMISPDVQENGLVMVYCTLDSSKDLLPGMYLKATVYLDSYEAMSLPSEAVVSIDGKDHVLVLQSQGSELAFNPVQVQVGENLDDRIEILSSEKLNGQKVVTKGAYFLVN